MIDGRIHCFFYGSEVVEGEKEIDREIERNRDRDRMREREVVREEGKQRQRQMRDGRHEPQCSSMAAMQRAERQRAQQGGEAGMKTPV